MAVAAVAPPAQASTLAVQNYGGYGDFSTLSHPFRVPQQAGHPQLQGPVLLTATRAGHRDAWT
jgi:hypothetical protein